MDLIEATLAKKRSALESATGGAKKKYIRRGELERQREQDYLEQERERKEKEVERERKLKEDQEAKRITEITERASSLPSESTPSSSSASTPIPIYDGVSSPAPSQPSTATTTTTTLSSSTTEAPEDLLLLSSSSAAAAFNIPPEEVVRRLRARGQPIRLFAETDQQRKIRLRALELVEDRSEGQRNDFMRALENAETGLHMEALGHQGGNDTKDKKKRRKENLTKDQDTTLISIDLLEKDQDKLYVLIYTYFKRLLREWEHDLDQRPDELKRSTPGKLATATQAQTAEYLKPFFKQLRHKALEPDVLMRITEIAELMQKRQHMSASDAYLKLSIGNAPWPIGVTMVGIHERSGREKIFSAQVAHVLNDETSRKWIQSIKRIMTFAEKKYPM